MNDLVLRCEQDSGGGTTALRGYLSSGADESTGAAAAPTIGLHLGKSLASWW